MATPLHRAVGANDEAKVRRLLALAPPHRPDVNERDGNGWTPLHEAAHQGHEGIARLLLEHGADAEAKNNFGSTPLHGAAVWEREGVARLLLEHGADVEAKDSIGRSPLNWAAREGFGGVVRLLLEHGADTGAKDDYGHTPRTVAQGAAVVALFASLPLRCLNILARPRPALPNEITPETDYEAFHVQCLNVTIGDVERIFLNLTDPRDVAQLRLVCKTWRRVADGVLAERPEAFFA